MATLHIGMSKDYVVACVRKYGARAVIPGWNGTDDEAVSAVLADPREVFATCDCLKTKNGACSGRKAGEA